MEFVTLRPGNRVGCHIIYRLVVKGKSKYDKQHQS